MEIQKESKDINEQGKPCIRIKDDDVTDLQIEENMEDSKDISLASQGKGDIVMLSSNRIPGDLISSSTLPIATGDIAITNSDNIQFGHNTYFNGPVTIIQNKSGTDNPAYDNHNESSKSKKESKADDAQLKKFYIQRWHKVTFTAIVFISVGCITGLVLDIYNRKSQEKMQDSNSGDTKIDDPLVIANNHLRIVSRTDWLAQPITAPLDKIVKPVPWVIIMHTATENCTIQSECVLRVRLIQTFHMESRKWYDIGYNFLLGGDGSAYEGRGWDSVGAHTKGYNDRSISIAFIGTFNSDKPPKRQFEACKKLIKLGVDKGELAKDYKLLAHRQLMSTLSPGQVVYDVIKDWPHFFKNGSLDD